MEMEVSHNDKFECIRSSEINFETFLPAKPWVIEM